MRHYLPLLLLAGLALTTSCKEDTEAPVIDFLVPNEGSSYAIGETILLVAEIRDNKELATINFDVYDDAGNPAANFDWFAIETLSKTKTASYDIDWSLSTEPVGNYSLRFAVTDQAGNETVSSRGIIVTP